MISSLGSVSPLFSSPLGKNSASPGASGLGGPQNSFAATLGDLASRTVGNLENAERVSALGLQGKADTRDVVDAVMAAEQSLQTAVAIRDKIVTAYLEVSRMAI